MRWPSPGVSSRAAPRPSIQRGLRAFSIFALTLCATACLVLGLTQPVVQLTRLYFWRDTHSITSIISALYYTNEIFLAGIIFIFSIIFPVFKLIYITLAGTLITFDSPSGNRWFKRIEWLGKWSMLDVLVLALLVFYAKSTTLADAIALPGIYFFAASVILTMLAYGLVKRDEAPPVRSAEFN
jgi:paraquat-inducible protein A